MRRAPLFATVAMALTPVRATAQGLPPSLASFLRQAIQLNEHELNASADGEAVAKLLPDSDSREIAVFGMVQVDVPRPFYVGLASAFPSSLRTPMRTRLAVFSDPVADSDVAGFSLSPDDIRDLVQCRPGACDLKLSATGMARARAVIDSAGRNADSAVNAFFRKAILAYVTNYRARGNGALVVYEDAGPTAAQHVFDGILSRSRYVYRYAPSLQQYLLDYPANRPANLVDVLFWAQDALPNLRATFTIAHQLVYAPPELPGCTLLVTKQLYADHYFDGGLTITAVVDGVEQAGGPPLSYVVLLEVWHFDKLPSGGLLRVRERVSAKLRDHVEAMLRAAKRDAEQRYAAARSP
jgi:hypothetical protein